MSSLGSSYEPASIGIKTRGTGADNASIDITELANGTYTTVNRTSSSLMSSHYTTDYVDIGYRINNRWEYGVTLLKPCFVGSVLQQAGYQFFWGYQSSVNYSIVPIPE